jgi:hypothetical protein
VRDLDDLYPYKHSIEDSTYPHCSREIVESETLKSFAMTRTSSPAAFRAQA